MGKRSKGELTNVQHSKRKRTRDTNNKSEVKIDSMASNKPKKIVFDEDGNPEQQTEEILHNATRNKASIQKSSGKKNKIKNTQNISSESEQSKERTNQSEDDEAKEEDIDKFCDEIEEEDNEQYENWVKLIEEKLTSNKKKS